MKQGDIYLGRKVLHVEHLPASGTFLAFYNTEKRLIDLGFIIGSMDRDNPIGFAQKEKYGYIAKWYNLSEEDKEKLDGVILSKDFREGAVEIVFFNEPPSIERSII